MWKLLGWIHAKLYQGVLWVLLLPFRAVWSFLRVVLLLLGEEFRRWAAIGTSGAMVYFAGKATLNLAPAELRKPLAMTVLVLAAVWAVAAMRAAHYTMHNSLRWVRQRQAFRQLAGDVNTIHRRLSENLARRTQGSRAGRLFRSNRDADDAANERAEAQRRAADEQAEAERQAAYADERRRDELAELEPSPY